MIMTITEEYQNEKDKNSIPSTYVKEVNDFVDMVNQ